MEDAVLSLLRACARADPALVDHGCLSAAADRIGDWAAVVDGARAHGLTPLVYQYLANAGVDVPVAARQELFAGSVLHRDSARAHLQALGEILDAFDRAGIPALVLKGAALGHLLYSSPALRPLGDLDLLVDPRLAACAQSTLSEVGFLAPAERRRLAPHHHLPLATRQRDGYVVQVEIHRDAISPDSPGTITWNRLTSPTQTFALVGRTAQALGHADMLHHLARHVAEVASRLRLIWVTDLVGYATRYRHEIAWRDLRQRHPFVLNALALAHAVTPLPPELLVFVSPGSVERLSGAGIALRPLSAIAAPGRPAADIVRELFAPPEWWMHLHYGVEAGTTLAWTRTVRHPLWVARWLGRRALRLASD